MPGHVAPSYGIHCARLADVPAPVLERATDILAAVAAGQPLVATRADPRLAMRNAHCLAMVQALIDFDPEAGDVNAFLADMRSMAEEADAELQRLHAEPPPAEGAEGAGGSHASGDAEPPAAPAGSDGSAQQAA